MGEQQNTIGAEYDRMTERLREEILPARSLRLLACRWAWRVLPWGPMGDDSRELVEVSQRYALGEVDEAALDAAWDDLRVVKAAAWTTSSDAGLAAREVGWITLCKCAGQDYDAERARQIEDVRTEIARPGSCRHDDDRALALALMREQVARLNAGAV